ncbi:hypothetical protein AAG906_020028 [Vitis piasezkii]
MARTRGAKSSSPSSRKKPARGTPVQGSTFEPLRPLVVPPLVEDAPLSPSVRRYLTRSGGRPPQKKARILEHLGYPSEPQLEHKRICREIFTLERWTSMTAYSAEPRAPAGAEHPDIPQQSEEPQPAQIPADTRPPAPVEPIPEVTPSALPATPQTPPVIPATSEPPTSSESRIAISISEYRGLCHTLQTLTTSQSILTQQMTALRAHQEQILATQTQHTAILR